MSSELKVDTISEKTSANGVTIDGVNLKDSVVKTDTISEKTSAAGVTIDGLLIKDGAIPSIAGGKLLQVTLGTHSTNTTIYDTSYVDTGLSASITPSATSSKILVLVNHSVLSWAPGAIPWGYIQILRDSTALTNRSLGIKARLHGDNNNYVAAPFQLTFLDSPNSTSSITYKTQAQYAGSGSGYIGVGYQNLMQHIILMEIGA